MSPISALPSLPRRSSGARYRNPRSEVSAGAKSNGSIGQRISASYLGERRSIFHTSFSAISCTTKDISELIANYIAAKFRAVGTYMSSNYENTQ